MPKFSRILCPVDFDANSSLALKAASELAAERKAALFILHVIAIPPGPEVALPFEKMETAARTRLKRLADQKIGRRADYEIEVMIGDPGAEILSAARQHRAELIVMATHGRKGLRRLMLGSVAERVVREAPCPVLTVKPKVSRSASTRSMTAKARV
ncbi:MAG TPA: universal stress protein [Candidatus Binataceae bacterium]|jgi:nucleotide-binding universal stress UspA family protein|nr:universal stress protein [Candidatus Binataceae bacterium]